MHYFKSIYMKAEPDVIQAQSTNGKFLMWVTQWWNQSWCWTIHCLVLYEGAICTFVISWKSFKLSPWENMEDEQITACSTIKSIRWDFDWLITTIETGRWDYEKIYHFTQILNYKSHTLIWVQSPSCGNLFSYNVS